MSCQFFEEDDFATEEKYSCPRKDNFCGCDKEYILPLMPEKCPCKDKKPPCPKPEPCPPCPKPEKEECCVTVKIFVDCKPIFKDGNKEKDECDKY